MSVWNYHRWLPAVSLQHRLYRGEGRTPLVRSVAMGRILGLPNLFFKLENLNPTGSYKDRFAAVTVSLLLQSNKSICMATSSGNTGAALAAYCAAAGIRCIIFAVDGAPADKLLQMQLYGAEVVEVKGFGVDELVTTRVFEGLEKLAEEYRLPFPVSAYKFHPLGMEGVETIAMEILDEVHAHHIFAPAGGGGLTLAIANGCNRYTRDMLLPVSPGISCVQPEGNNTIAGSIRDGKSKSRPLAHSSTSVSGLQVPAVLDGDAVVAACTISGGMGYVVSDEEIFQCQYDLATREGIFCEPAGAVALAGVARAVKEKRLQADENVVCLVTGSGFKHIGSVKQHFALHPVARKDADQALSDYILHLDTPTRK